MNPDLGAGHGAPIAVLLRSDGPRLEEGLGDVLGGKGAALARMVVAGDPVPLTGVVTTAGYRRVAVSEPVTRLLASMREGDPTDAEAVDGVFASAPLPENARRLILDIARQVGRGGPIAVRSSATVEDLHGSSFAGQYCSFLNVDSTDDDAVVAAVRRVWASLWHPAPTAYRRAFGVPEADVAMAVVMMRMIPATTAGVVFTLDPGGSADARIEAVEGLGESLVSGARTPSAWVVSRDVDKRPDLPKTVATALDLSLAIEGRTGVPQDVEWAALEDEVFLVQARPITVLDTDDGFDTELDDHELTTAGIVEMVPGVLPPLRWEVNRFILEESFRSILDSLGIIRGAEAEEYWFVRRVRGRAAVDFDQLKEAASVIPGAVEELELQYFGEMGSQGSLLPSRHASIPTNGVSRLKSWVSGVQRDLRAVQTRGRVIDQADIVVGAVEGLWIHRRWLFNHSQDELVAYSQRLIDLAARGLAAELGVATVAATAFSRLERLLARHVGSEEAARVAMTVTARSAVGVTRPEGASAAVFGGPTWTELGSSPVHHPTPAESGDVDEVGALVQRLKSLPGWKRTRILTGQFVDVRIHVVRRAVTDARDQLRRRESTKAAVMMLGGELRRVNLELGRRLVAQGLLTNETEIELLTTAEIAALRAGQPTHRNDTLRRRANWISRFEAEGPLPPRFIGTPDRQPAPLPEGDVLSGWASSPGRRSGTARVFTSPKETLTEGEILVAVSTDASWSPLFVNAGAVIVEQGGPLSHAAILARELGLPAVLNIEGATRVLDGCRVTVDGDAGVVVIEERPGRNPGIDDRSSGEDAVA